MGIVSAEELNRHLSGPHWSPEQWQEAAVLVEEIEDGLSAALGAVPIDCGAPIWERAPLDPSTGLLATRWPIAEVLSLDGVMLDPNATELPDGWTWGGGTGGWLYRAEREPEASAGVATLGGPGLLDRARPLVFNAPDAPGGFWPSEAGRQTTMVGVRYRPGWAGAPALVGAIKRKAGDIFTARHDDTITARELDGTRPSSSPPTTGWTPEELAALRRFRVIPV